MKILFKNFFAFFIGIIVVGAVHYIQSYFSDTALNLRAMIIAPLIGGGITLIIWNLYITISRYKDEEFLSNQLYRDFVENINDIIFSLDNTGKITYISPVIKQITGFDPAQLLNQPFSILVYPDDSADLEKSMQKTLSGNLEPAVFRIETKANKIKWVRSFSKPIYFKGKISGMRGVIVDITDIKNTEKKLSYSESKFKAIFNNAGDIILIHNFGKKFLEVNNTACQMLGYTRNELLDINPIEIFNTDLTNEMAGLENKLLAEKKLYYETEYVTKAGMIIPVEISSSIIEFDGSEAVLCSARDISERKELIKERKRSERLESLGVLSGGIAHEFNNLLMVITGNLYFLINQAGDEKDRMEYLLDTENASKRLQTLTEQLLTYSRNEPLVKITVNIYDIIQKNCIKYIIPPDYKYEIINESTISEIIADERMMEMAFSSLINNSIQAMKNGGLIIIRLENYYSDGTGVLLLKRGDYLKISITDTGHGIDMGIIERIFDPFFTTYPEKSGLGLTNTFTILKRHEGYLDVKSEKGAGTTFILYIPVKEPSHL